MFFGKTVKIIPKLRWFCQFDVEVQTVAVAWNCSAVQYRAVSMQFSAVSMQCSEVQFQCTAVQCSVLNCSSGKFKAFWLAWMTRITRRGRCLIVTMLGYKCNCLSAGSALHYTAVLHCTTLLYCTALHCCISLHYTASLHCASLHRMHCTALHCTKLYCTILLNFALR